MAGTPNRLIHEKSPYLLQHASNPVDWYPWGEEAFQKAQQEDKPIFLSVGYSTCYWCHVMEREDFENPATARLMNEHFVCIKVDREERPDVDRVYMAAVQALTGSGGWPMSVFLTPDRKPFFGGTYFPPAPQVGRPGFPQLLEHISKLWHTERRKIVESSLQITEFLRANTKTADAVPLDDSTLQAACSQFAEVFDKEHAGFGAGPKFPQPVTFNFLLRYYSRSGEHTPLDMTLATLRKMAEGGMYDQIGGGFHRYSVDAQWRVPHFEKMLYDQAQLASSYVDAYQITRDEFFASMVRDILDYVLRSMTHSEGGFYSAEDAESLPTPAGQESTPESANPSMKKEGAFYLWTKKEIEDILGREIAPIVDFYYGVKDQGNALHDPMNVFVGQNILYIWSTVEETAWKFNKTQEEIQELLLDSRKKLFAEREKRPKPHLDDKIITAWNGLMISAFSRAYQVLGDPKHLSAAERSAVFVASKLYDPVSVRLLRRYRDGEARFDGTLQDYAFFIQGLLDLYEASFDIQWLALAIDLAKKQIELFGDPEQGGFFDTAPGDMTLFIRTKDDYDGAEPAGNSVAALTLLRLARVTDNKEWSATAEKTIDALSLGIRQYPTAHAQMLAALDWRLSTPLEIIIAGKPDAEDTRLLLKAVHAHFVPNRILLLADGSEGQKKLAQVLPFIDRITTAAGKATAYVCENYSCQLPTSDPMVLGELLLKRKNSRNNLL
ncbi:MAG: thioredoxin domain-containing protein [Bacteroidota bacterium]|jgi:uncharacterized protein YyaL (SSP411 family)